MTLLTVMEYLCHRRPRICPVYRTYNPIIPLSLIYQRIFNKNNSAIIGAGTANHSRAPDFSPRFYGVLVASSLVFCVVFFVLLFVVLPLLGWPLYCLSFEVRLLIT
jgi:hypothetical protein